MLKLKSWLGKLLLMGQLLVGLLLLCGIFLTFMWHNSDLGISYSKEDLKPYSHRIFRDRYGRMLGFPPDSQGRRCVWVSLAEISEPLKNAFLAAEDARFYEHSGYDFKAITRAFLSNILEGRIVSGASTISQQVIRLVYPAKRTYSNKLKELYQSLQMEDELSKSEILEQYLNRVPMGNQLYGVESAALRYFDKRCEQLSLAECALLASLPKAPSRYNPYGNYLNRLLKRKDWVLERMYNLGFITDEELKNALDVPMTFNKTHFPFRANHFVEMLKQDKELGNGNIITTIDLDIQTAAKNILQSHKHRLSNMGAYQASALILNNKTMDVLAMVGSMEYSKCNQGYNNGSTALRSAGSTLKPFLYGLAFEMGHSPATIISDTKKSYLTPMGAYLPYNYDRRFHGPVTIRTALGNSLNISAVKMLELLGLKRFYKLLDTLNLITDHSKISSYYGLGLAIGNLEVTLTQLVAAYATLANQGIYRELRFIKDEKTQPPKRVLQPETAYLITDILSDATARTLTFGTRDLYNFPYKLAQKTGTSTYYRDGWVIGYTPDYTVGIWVGNFDGAHTYRLSGAAGAGPILKDIISFLYQSRYPLGLEKPDNIINIEICGLSGMSPSPWCPHLKKEIFIKGTGLKKICDQHTGNNNYRSISPIYAKWLYNKNLKGVEGTFRLADYDYNLDKVFTDPWQASAKRIRTPAIRIAGNSRKNTSSKTPTIVQPSISPENKHYSIGKLSSISNTSSADRIGIPKILYPLPGDRFVAEFNNSRNYIEMQAQSETAVEYLLWIIDGVEYAKTPPPFTIYWEPTRGKHSVSIVNPSNRGSSVNFSVE